MNCFTLNLFHRYLPTIILLAIFAGRAYAQEITFAFIDTLAPATSLDGTARARLLIQSLQRLDVTQSPFLIRTSDINTKTQARLDYYHASGQLLVNAGHRRFALSRQTINDLQQDIAKADRELVHYPSYQHHIYLPFFSEQDRSTSRNKLALYFAQQHYHSIGVTWQGHDDYMDHLYQARVRESKFVDMDRLQRAYVEFLVNEIVTYDMSTRLLLGYSPRQIVLLHATDLTAYSIIDLIDTLRAKGYSIAANAKNISDPIAKGFSAEFYQAPYQQLLAGFVSAGDPALYSISADEQQKIHRYLTAAGLSDWLPVNRKPAPSQ